MSFTAGDLNAIAAGWLNNPTKSIYTDAKLLICLAQAQRDLQDALIENNISFLRKKSQVIPVLANALNVTLPNDFYEPIEIDERPSGGKPEDWDPIQYKEFIRNESPSERILQWTYNQGIIEINPPSTPREVRLFYRATFTIVSTVSSVIDQDEYKSYLGFRTAALAAATIGENESRAIALEAQANISLGAVLRLGVKQNQEQPARRLPYRSASRHRRFL